MSVFSLYLASASHFKSETLNKLEKEIQQEILLGPFLFKPISTLRISPIGLVPKHDGGWRLITNLSHPSENSVNGYIDSDVCKVKYSSFDSVLSMIYKLGCRAKIGKIYIS